MRCNYLPASGIQGRCADGAVCAGTREYESRMIYKIRSTEVKAVLGKVIQAKQDLESIARDLEARGWK
jgi:hypothetical protein